MCIRDREWSDSLKDIQRNWIGRSQGADVIFDVKDSDIQLKIFTTRPDTIYGVSFMVLAPESDYVRQLTTPDQEKAVAEYLDYVAKRTERERQSEIKTVTGVFTGSYAMNPFTNEAIPVWISEYVLAGYGTGAIMADVYKRQSIPRYKDKSEMLSGQFFANRLIPGKN